MKKIRKQRPQRKERWKAIPDYGGLYEASDYGQVRSLDMVVKYKNGGQRRQNGRVLRLGKWKYGRQCYLQVSLSDCNGGRKTWSVHQLVMLAFIGPCPEGLECCHNDRDGTNNCLENLRYDTRKGNQADRKLHGTDNAGSKHPCSKFTEEEVAAIRDEYTQGGVTSRQLAERYGVNPKGMYNLLNRRTWKQAGGADCTEMLKHQAAKPNSKLTEEEVLEIRHLYEEEDWGRDDLIEEFGVSRSSINKILSRRTWSDV